jgi:hypothetical protein
MRVPLIEIDLRPFIPQIVGFLLFSVMGALLAARFQYRSWKRQWLVRETSRRIDTATAAYEEVSRVIDTRIFRMKQLVHALRGGDPARIAERRKEYREVLYQWNENLNRYLAKLQIYFGPDTREKYDAGLATSIVGLAREIQKHLDGKVEEGTEPLASIEEKLAKLDIDAFNFNVELINKIEKNERFVRPLAEWQARNRRACGKP